MKRYNESDNEYRRRKQREDEEHSSDNSGKIGIGIGMTTGQVEPTLGIGGSIGIGFNGDLTVGI